MSLRRYIICEKMHWDYWTYARQPVHFIKEIWEFLGVEGQVKKDIERENR